MSENNSNENKSETKKHHHRSRSHSHSSSGSGSRHHHHHSRKSSSYRESTSSEMERKGKSIIYKNVRKNKILQTIKRTIFVIVSVAIISFVLYAIVSEEENSNFGFFIDKGVSVEEVNELKIKIVEYEEYIEELEQRLSQYETVEGLKSQEK